MLTTFSAGPSPAENYAVMISAGETAADNKIYDGATNVSGDTFDDDRLAGDDLTFTYTVSFEDKKAGANKTINFSSITINSGSDMDNYNLLESIKNIHWLN